jgi:predicted DCC family thiol-disulfide oxidoreductase YuxK
MPVMDRLHALVTSRINARALGIVRIAIGFAALLVVVEEAPALWRLADPAVLRVPYIAGLTLPTWLFPALAVLGGGAACAFALGLWTSTSGALLAFALGGILVADQQLYSNHLYLLTLTVILLTIGGAGASFSLDARRRGATPEEATVPAWPALLLRIQVGIVYAYAALAKVNIVYLSGSVVASYLRTDGFLGLPPEWRAFAPMFVLSLLAIATEAFLAVALWIPRWRPTAFIVGLGLHAAITVWLVPTYQLFIYSLVILPLYLLFLPSARGAYTVVWDDSCSFCTQWVRWARRLDWLGALRFVPSSNESEIGSLGVTRREADTALQFIRPDGSRRAGFDAVRGIAELTPLCFLWAPLMALPPVRAMGTRTYRSVAARRTCAVAPDKRLDAEQAQV